MTTPTTTRITDVRTVAVPVTDQDRALGFYTGIRLTTANAAADHAGLRSQGVDTGELLLWDEVPPMFSFLDPDGNRLYVVESG